MSITDAAHDPSVGVRRLRVLAAARPKSLNLPSFAGEASDKLHSTKSQVFPLKRCSFMYLMTR